MTYPKGTTHVHYASFDSVDEMKQAFASVKLWGARHVAGQRHKLASVNLKTRPNQVSSHYGEQGESIAALHSSNSHYNAWHCMGRSSVMSDGENGVIFHVAIRQFLNSNRGALFAMLRCHKNVPRERVDLMANELCAIGRPEKKTINITGKDTEQYKNPGSIAAAEPLLVVVPRPKDGNPDPQAIRIANTLTEHAAIAIVDYPAMVSLARRIESAEAQHVWVTSSLILRVDSPVSMGNYSIGSLPLDEAKALEITKHKEGEIAIDILYSSALFSLKMSWDDAQLLSTKSPGRPSNSPQLDESDQIAELQAQLAKAREEITLLKSDVTHPEPDQDHKHEKTAREVVDDEVAYPHVIAAPRFPKENLDAVMTALEASEAMGSLERLGRALENTPHGRVGNYTNFFRQARAWKFFPPNAPESEEPQQLRLVKNDAEQAEIMAVRHINGIITLKRLNGKPD